MAFFFSSLVLLLLVQTDQMHFLRHILVAQKIEVFVLQRGKLNLTSAAGKLMLTMLSAVAEMERDLLVERTQAGLAWAKKEGKTFGRPTKKIEAQVKGIIDKHLAGATISALSRQYGVSRLRIPELRSLSRYYNNIWRSL